MTARKMLSTTEAMKIRGCSSRTTIWTDVRAGRFPKPVIFQGRKYFYEDELEEWQRALPRGQGQGGFKTAASRTAFQERSLKGRKKNDR